MWGGSHVEILKLFSLYQWALWLGINDLAHPWESLAQIKTKQNFYEDLTLNKYIDVGRELFNAFSLSRFLPLFLPSPFGGALNGKTSLSVRPQRGKNAIGIAEEGGIERGKDPNSLDVQPWQLCYH